NLLRRDEKLDAFADNILNTFSNNIDEYHGIYGKIFYKKKYDNNTVLDKAEAETIFFEWFSKEQNHNYHFEPLINNA
ncbi:hypothetical protein NL492_27595, partial [Klebsiella pneumoniae]|nr:hypothetical protein [Klebsiella pneumoniae]